MSDTWNASGDNGEWNANAPISSLSSESRKKWQYEAISSHTGNRTRHTFVTCMTEAEAQDQITAWNTQASRYGNWSYVLVGATSTQAPQPANGQKAIAPMKLTFNRQSLITSLQAVVDKAAASVADAQAKFDVAVATATGVVDANLATIAKANGFSDDADGQAAFKKSPRYNEAITGMQFALGLPGYAPVKPNTKATEAAIATLNLATDETLEIEEGHRFIAHLG